VIKVEGKNNATFFGFYTEGDEVLQTVKVSVSGNADVQIGEFQIGFGQ